MKAVLDTNFYCLCDTGNQDAVTALSNASSILIPAVVFGELYYGFKYGTRFYDNNIRLKKFMIEFEVAIIHVDEDVATHFGDIYANLRRRGKPIPTNDIWIAASAMNVGGSLLTLDRHFRYIPEIHATFF